MGAPAVVFSTTNSGAHLAEVATLVAPQGRYALIDDPQTLDVKLLKWKSISLHWEMMFTRSLYGTEDMQAQHEILNKVSELVDDGRTGLIPKYVRRAPDHHGARVRASLPV
jgi:NADPH2:quinone reductase